MATRNLETSARRLHAGEIAFGAYASATRDEYERMAAMLTRRWAPPGWVEQADVVQDLFLGTWQSVWKFDPALSGSIGNFVVYNSISAAKRRLHKVRGANLHGNPGKNPSRMEVSISALQARRGGEPVTETVDEMISRLARRIEDGWEDSPEDRAIAAEEGHESVRIVIATCRTDAERRIIGAIVEAGPDMAAAGRRLCGDSGIRETFGVGPDEVDVMVALAESIAQDVVARVHGERLA